MVETLRIEIPIAVKNDTGDEISKIIRETQQLEEAAKKAASAVSGINDAVTGLAAASKTAKGSMDGVRQAAENLGEASKSAMDTVKETGNYVGKLGDAAKTAEASVNNADKKLTRFEQSMQKTTDTLNKMVREKYQVVLEALDKASPILKILGSTIRSLSGKVWNITMKAVDLVTVPVKRILSLLKNSIFQVGAVLGVSVGLKDTIDTYASFEAAMSQVKALSGATGYEFQGLTEKAKQMGAATKFTAAESAEAFRNMALSGWDAAEMLDGMEGIFLLAAASGESLASTSDIMADALSAFGKSAKDSAYFADVLAQVSVNSKTNVSQLGEALKYVGTISGSLGYDISDIAMALGLMAANGLKGSAAGISMNAMLTRLAANTDGARDAVAALGIAFYDELGSARDLSLIMSELRQATAGMTDEQKTSLANTVAGLEAQKGLLSILDTTVEDYEDLAEALKHATGAAARMADTMMDNLKGAFTLLQGAADGVKILLGERLKPYIQSFVIWLRNKMPDIQDAVTRAMDAIDKSMIRFRHTMRGVMNSTEWENANLFGKVKIAWDELITNPFMKWWKGTGKRMIADAMGTIGKGLGTGIGTGLMTILGFNISGAVDDGLSIGTSFARGFSEGFNQFDIKSSIGGAVKGIFSSAGGIFTSDSNILNWISALLIGKTAITAGKGIGAGMKLFGGASKIWGSVSTTAELAGVGGMTGTGIMGGLAHLGLGMNGLKIASSGAGLAATGAAGIAGGVVAGAALVSAVKDLKTAYDAKDEKERNVNLASAGMKAGGVAAGAVIGSMILPGIGTLVGAGIGGAMGWYSGNRAKAAYEEELERAEQRAYALALAEEQAKYESIELKDALADTTISAEEFAKMLEDVVAKDMASRFGDISLSLAEIQELAKQITFGDSIHGLKKFSDAAYQARNDYTTLVNAMDAMDKMNWQASFGNMSEDEVMAYQSSIESVLKDSQKYLTNRHYEVTTAINLLYGNEDSTEFIAGVNELFAGLQDKLEVLNGELNKMVEVALEDGIIDPDEMRAIREKLDELTEIRNILSNSQTNSSLELLRAKYGGSNLTSDSFMTLQMELGPIVEDELKAIDDAFRIAVDYADKLRANGTYTDNQYRDEIDTATELLNSQRNEWIDNSLTYQLEVITDRYGNELSSVLPDFDGTMIEQLMAMIQDAFWHRTDFSRMDYNDDNNRKEVAELFGLLGLHEEPQKAISELLILLAQSIPKGYFETLDDIKMASQTYDYEYIEGIYNELMNVNREEIMGPTYEMLRETIESLDDSFLLAGTKCGNSLIENISEALLASKSKIRLGLNPLRSEIENELSKPYNIDINVSYNSFRTSPFTSSWIVPDEIGPDTIYNANGGLINSKVLSWVGEEGPEMIIPLVSGRRRRGLELWEQAGKLLGVRGNAIGGMASSSSMYSANSNSYSEVLNYLDLYGTSTSGGTYEGFGSDSLSWDYGVTNNGGSDNDITIQINMNPSFDIQSSGTIGSDDDGIVKAIKGYMREMADELSGEIAMNLEQVFSNMPKKGLI